jgi:hypothetical protein
MVSAVCLEVLDTLRYRKDEHHRNDGHSTESLERERHSKFILNSWPFGRGGFQPPYIRQDTAQFV